MFIELIYILSSFLAVMTQANAFRAVVTFLTYATRYIFIPTQWMPVACMVMVIMFGLNLTRREGVITVAFLADLIFGLVVLYTNVLAAW